MKFKYWALGLLACGGLMACSNNDDITDEGGKTDGGNATTSYLAVNILNTGSTGTRADEYQNGSESENKINEIRFYLFDASGNAYELTNGKSYAAPTYSAAQNPDTGGNIEKIGNAVLVFQGEKPVPPASIVAVANGSGLAEKYSLSDLKKVLASDYKDGSGNFTMSNSVYVDGGKVIDAVSVEGHVTDSPESAKVNPVDIYIERLAAKVKVSFSGENWYTIGEKPAYLLTGTAGEDGAVYAQVQGWILVSIPTGTNLIKDINPSWSNDDLGYSSSSPWNSADYHRSFWAQMPASGITYPTSFTPADITSTAETYTLENTSENDKTELLVYVKLVNKDGGSVSRYVYLGDDKSYASEEDVLTEILSVFNNVEGKTYYIKTAETDVEASYKSLASGNLKFVSGASLNMEDNSYRAYAQLNIPFAGAIEAAKEKLYYKDSDGSFKEADVNTINTSLKNYSAQIWTDGSCYYTTTIKHNGGSGKTAEFGVVRNHIYDLTITSITGYGTPVYNPSEEITKPVTPKEDHSYLAARVNILSWKVVSNNVTLGQ